MSACPICGRQVPEQKTLLVIRSELDQLIGSLGGDPKHGDALAAARRAKALLQHAMGDARP